MTAARVVAVLFAALTAQAANAQFSAVRLQPLGVTDAILTGVEGNLRVGWQFAATSHGYLWTGSNPTPTDFGAGSALLAIHAGQFGGSQDTHAAIWNGTPAARTDLSTRPSAVYSLFGNQQVGFQYDAASNAHATLWTGTAASAVDLNPSGYAHSYANGTDGDHQYGWGQDPDGVVRALVWDDTAASVQDLTPVGATLATIDGVGGGLQVGHYHRSGNTLNRAILWAGTLESAQDMHPAAFSQSALEATNGFAEVGQVTLGTGATHAAVWFGTAASCIDLHAFLPAGYTRSEATSVTFDNGLLVIGGYARSATSHNEAFIWTAVPAPASGVILLVPLFFARRR